MKDGMFSHRFQFGQDSAGVPKPKVAVCKWSGPGSLDEALEAVDAWRSFRPGMSVLIKPNAVMAGTHKMSCRGITTSPAVIKEIIRTAREKGAGRLVIAEGAIEVPVLKLDTAAAYRWSGIRALAEEENVALLDLNKSPHRVFTLSDGASVEIAEEVFRYDFIINVPVLKTHHQTVITICLKNLKGCLSPQAKKNCHIRTNLDQAIAEINFLIPCHLNVVDALTATEIGPTPTGRPDQVHELGLILAGRDRLACDVVGSFLLGYPAAQVPHLVEFARLTNRGLRLDDIAVVGENPTLYAKKIEYGGPWVERILEKFSVKGVRVLPYGDGLCSSCGFSLCAGLYKFGIENSGAEITGSMEVCVGSEATASCDLRHIVLLGECAIKRNRSAEHALMAPGCPPSPQKIAAALSKALISHRRKGDSVSR